MTGGVVKVREISLGEEFGDVAVRVNGIRVEIRAEGVVAISTAKGGLVLVSTAALVSAAANDDAKSRAVMPLVGNRMPDGTVYAGVSPDTGKPLYAAHGHEDWRLPTKAELNVLFNNHTVIGGFNGSGSSPSGWYWSSTEHQSYAGNAWIERFSDGHRNWRWKGNDASVRPVRG